MSNASFTSRPLGTAMVGGAIAMATLDILIQKNVLTVDDAQAVLKTAQSSLVNSPRVYGSLDGARIIGEIKDELPRTHRPFTPFHTKSFTRLIFPSCAYRCFTSYHAQ
jgi:hypothetical protein